MADNEAIANQPKAPQTTPNVNIPTTYPNGGAPHASANAVVGNSLNASALANEIKKFVDDKNSAAYLNQIPSLFNILHGMGQASEIRYSNFINWLMDPTANHGLEDLFVNSLIEKLVADGKFKEYTTDANLVSVPQYNPQPTGETYSKTEALGQSIDIVYRNDKKGICLIIENKTEGSNLHLSNFGIEKSGIDEKKPKVIQLEKYFEVLCPSPGATERVTENFRQEAEAIRKLPKVFLFLTPYGDPVDVNLKKAKLDQYIAPGKPWFDVWIPISYSYLESILDACIKELYQQEAAATDPDEARRIQHARISIQDFRWDQHRRFDENMDSRVASALGIVDAKTDLGALGRELIAALLDRGLGLDEDQAKAAGGAYYDEFQNLQAHSESSNFNSQLTSELDRLKVSAKHADIVLRDIFWIHKPKVVGSAVREEARNFFRDCQKVLCIDGPGRDLPVKPEIRTEVGMSTDPYDTGLTQIKVGNPKADAGNNNMNIRIEPLDVQSGWYKKPATAGFYLYPTGANHDTVGSSDAKKIFADDTTSLHEIVAKDPNNCWNQRFTWALYHESGKRYITGTEGVPPELVYDNGEELAQTIINVIKKWKADGTLDECLRDHKAYLDSHLAD